MNPTFFQYAMYVVPWAAFIHYYAQNKSLRTECEYLKLLHRKELDCRSDSGDEWRKEYTMLEAKYDRLVARLNLPTKNED
jgi:hypothetical protein